MPFKKLVHFIKCVKLIFLYYPLNISMISSNDPLFLINLSRGLSIINLFKEPAFVFDDVSLLFPCFLFHLFLFLIFILLPLSLIQFSSSTFKCGSLCNSLRTFFSVEHLVNVFQKMLSFIPQILICFHFYLFQNNSFSCPFF